MLFTTTAIVTTLAVVSLVLPCLCLLFSIEQILRRVVAADVWGWIEGDLVVEEKEKVVEKQQLDSCNNSWIIEASGWMQQQQQSYGCRVVKGTIH